MKLQDLPTEEIYRNIDWCEAKGMEFCKVTPEYNDLVNELGRRIINNNRIYPLTNLSHEHTINN
jgi:hypothetical protein